MRFRLGPIPESPDFDPQAMGWRPIREPRPWLFQLMALPIGLAAALLVIAAWSALVGTASSPSSPDGLVLGLLVLFLGVIPVHELFHALCHPGLGWSNATVFGFWPAKIVFYAHYDGALPRNRLLLTLLAPFVALSILPVALGAVFGLNHWLAPMLSGLNAVAACGDLLACLLVLAQVPKTGLLRNQGYYTFWRDPSWPEPRLEPAATESLTAGAGVSATIGAADAHASPAGRWCGRLVAFGLGAALAATAVFLATRRQADPLAEQFVAGLIDDVLVIREIRAGRGEALADRLAQRIPDYVWQIEEGFADSPWRAPAFRVAKAFVDETKPKLHDVDRHILETMREGAVPVAILRGGRVHVFPPGVSFEVPPGWQAWSLRFGNNLHTPQGDLRSVVHGAGEWDSEYGKIANALFPSERLVFHGGSSCTPRRTRRSRGSSNRFGAGRCERRARRMRVAGRRRLGSRGVEKWKKVWNTPSSLCSKALTTTGST